MVEFDGVSPEPIEGDEPFYDITDAARSHAGRFGFILTEEPKLIETIIASALIPDLYAILSGLWNIHREHSLDEELKIPIDEGDEATLTRRQSREGFVDYVLTFSLSSAGRIMYIFTEYGIGIEATIPNEDLTDKEGQSLKPSIRVLELDDLLPLAFIIGAVGVEEEELRA